MTVALFEVAEVGDDWGVFAVNPNNPSDRELATVCPDRDYAEMRAAALNRIAEMEPTKPQVKLEVPPRPRPLFDPETGEPTPKVESSGLTIERLSELWPECDEN
jgi:hypothetical protein